MGIQAIDHGATNWDKTITQNFSTLKDDIGNLIKDTGWQTAGISYLNGFSAGDSNLEYRTIDSTNQHILALCGWLKTPTMKANQKFKAFSLPLNVFGTGSHVDFNNICWWGDEWARISFDTSDGAAWLVNMGEAMKASSIAVNVAFIW